MAPLYEIKQGDYLAKIASDHGFADARTIWDDPQNKDLKAKRQNPNVLAPGDKIFIPDKQPKTEALPTEKKHAVSLKRSRNVLRLVLEDPYWKPIANAKCDLTVEGVLYPVVTASDGKIEQEVPPTAKAGELVIRDGETPLKNVKLQLQIGHLDPVEEVSGQKARLSNLGYYLGSPDADDVARFQCAVEEFQCDQRLTVDGICGPKTQAKLKQIHGC